MPSSASASDTSTNPLLVIQQHEEKEVRRMEEAKRATDQEESATIQKMEAEMNEQEKKMKTEAQAALKAFAQSEPAEILRRGERESEAEQKKIDAVFAAKKDALTRDLIDDFLSSGTH